MDGDVEAEGSATERRLAGGTYEIIRNRLVSHGDALRTRLASLNESRRGVFGSIELALLSNERVATANNCVPRDMIPVGDLFLFGYNVHFGLRTEIGGRLFDGSIKTQLKRIENTLTKG